MMELGIWIHTKRTAVKADLIHNSRFKKCVQSLVDSRQRYGRNLRPHSGVHLFRPRVSRHILQRVINHVPLVRSRKTIAVTQLAEPDLCLNLHKAIDEAIGKRIRL